jgi:DNA-binding transcriptional regulator YdaS (Cro superfamily)
MIGMALPNYTPERRHAIAIALSIHEQYLYQILRGLKTASPLLSRQINRIDPDARLQDLRPDDWHEIWPELAKQKRSKQKAEA